MALKIRLQAFIRFTKAAVLSLFLAATFSTSAHADLLVSGTRPNIVVVMTDDLDDMLLDTGLSNGILPVIQQTFVDSGIEFENSFVTNSVCCPSRATFLTGQYTHNHKVRTNSFPYAFPSFEDSSTLATWLSDANYQTGFVGKYLTRYAGPKDIDGDGSFDPDEYRYVPPGWDSWQALLDPTTYRVYNYNLLNNQTGDFEVYTDIYQTETLTAKSIEFIQNASTGESPFFLWINPLAPHAEDLPETTECTINTGLGPVPIYTIRPHPDHVGAAATIDLPRSDSFNEADISDKPNWLKAYAPNLLTETDVACVETVFRDKLESMMAVDDMIQDLLDAIDAAGQTANTIIILTSDNGFVYGHHRLIQPAKTLAFEEAIRVPLYVRDLSSTAAGRTVSLTALNNDLAPTIMDLTGAAIPASVDGRSLLPAIAQPQPTDWRKRFLVEHYFDKPVPTYSAIRSLGALPSTYVEYLSDYGAAGEWVGCEPGLCELYFMGSDPFQLSSRHLSQAVQSIIQSMELLSQSFRFCKDGLCQQLEDQ